MIREAGEVIRRELNQTLTGTDLSFPDPSALNRPREAASVYSDLN